jgi:lipase
MQFASYEAYRDWWRAHPALSGGDVEDSDLVAYADYDLTGSEPDLRSAVSEEAVRAAVSEEAVRADAAALFELGEDAGRLTIPATLLSAPRGLQDDPHPVQPIELARQWAARSPELRRAIEVPGVNHYTIVMGAAGARAVAAEVASNAS